MAERDLAAGWITPVPHGADVWSAGPFPKDLSDEEKPELQHAVAPTNASCIVCNHCWEPWPRHAYVVAHSSLVHQVARMSLPPGGSAITFNLPHIQVYKATGTNIAITCRGITTYGKTKPKRNCTTLFDCE